MEDAKEYIQRQIFPAGTRVRVSAIQYYEDDEHTYCPFCGSEQEQHSENGVFRIRCKQNCAGFQRELELIETQSNVKSELDKAQRRYELAKAAVEKHALDAGTKTAAKHYMELAAERQAFDSEVEKLTK
ncbi:MAG: hypothetical protein II304_14450 [Bacteroidales bacterium]|nr:hypothetical protein [Bacteroidales bacterium]